MITGVAWGYFPIFLFIYLFFRCIYIPLLSRSRFNLFSFNLFPLPIFISLRFGRAGEPGLHGRKQTQNNGVVGYELYSYSRRPQQKDVCVCACHIYRKVKLGRANGRRGGGCTGCGLVAGLLGLCKAPSPLPTPPSLCC